MFVYSKKIVKFIDDIKVEIKNVLFKDFHLKVLGDRFFDLSGRTSYPISVVIYNDRSMLGYFDAEFYNLGFHECLMHTSKDQLHNIIKHELAHYITFINYGAHIQSHGVEFRTCCQRMGWGEEVYKSTTCLDDGQSTFNIEESSVLRKIQKLMALSTSGNKNEAEQAMIKSQQLLLKHNVDSKNVESKDDEKVFLKRIMKQKRSNAKMHAIANVLKTFFVGTVYTRSSGFVYLEILGNAINIEIAEYVANTLDREFDNLWNQMRKEHTHLKGMVAKNSFFRGIAKGYCNKVDALKRDYGADVKNALMVIEKTLVDAQSLVYQRLSSMKSNVSHCQKSSVLGEQVGRQLNINPALNQSAKKSQALLDRVIK